MLPKESIHEQAEALAGFVRRGGCSYDWFQSKNFSSGDRKRILKPWRQLTEAKE